METPPPRGLASLFEGLPAATPTVAVDFVDERSLDVETVLLPVSNLTLGGLQAQALALFPAKGRDSEPPCLLFPARGPPEFGTGIRGRPRRIGRGGVRALLEESHLESALTQWASGRDNRRAASLVAHVAHASSELRSSGLDGGKGVEKAVIAARRLCALAGVPVNQATLEKERAAHLVDHSVPELLVYQAKVSQVAQAAKAAKVGAVEAAEMPRDGSARTADVGDPSSREQIGVSFGLASLCVAYGGHLHWHYARTSRRYGKERCDGFRSPMGAGSSEAGYPDDLGPALRMLRLGLPKEVNRTKLPTPCGDPPSSACSPAHECTKYELTYPGTRIARI